MTTGRINQVSKNQNLNARAQSYESEDEFAFAITCAVRTHKRREFYFHHRRSGIKRPPESMIQVVNPDTTDTTTNACTLAATRCDNFEFIKSTNTNSQTLYSSEEL